MITTKDYPEADQFIRLIEQATHILIIQPDNPDGDSLGSAIALEQIFDALGKQTTLVSGTNLSTYLNYIPGFDRVLSEIPNLFDLSIIVDTQVSSLISNLSKKRNYSSIFKRPVIILDHHSIESDLPKVDLYINDPTAVSTTELIFSLSESLKLSRNDLANKALAIGLLSDSLGLSTPTVSAYSIMVLAILVDQGVSINAIEEIRKQSYLKSPRIIKYKGQLLERIEYYLENKLNLLVIPFNEIEQFSQEYNPSMLVLEDMRLSIDTLISVIIKVYPDRYTAKIRSINNWPIANDLAKIYGGGGHPYAAGFKITNLNLSIDDLKKDIITKVNQLINNHHDKTIQ